MKPLHYTFYPKDVSTKEAFLKSLQPLIGNRIIEDNQITAYQNGNEFFPELQNAIQQAKYSINFETYAYWDGVIGETIAKDLIQAAKRGVQCNMVLDGFGAHRLKSKDVRAMQDAGVHVKFFRPIKWTNCWRLRWHNHRTHRR